ncbi:ZZ-type zinc finger-containing protein 3 [Hibiscus syriacus]|uniref:ZZ-type zinc finger-containing protein 3 n=1 Tax=Hibiscus syriacus TaxID=106335 RepID=A0A6A2W9S2_HIBSY|nr:ZZ-type zinc finger-containing protein 3 [Hibiscus syriacus]
MNRHALPFQSAVFSCSSDMIPVGGYFAPLPMFLPWNSSDFTLYPALIQPGNSSGSSFLLDSVAGLKDDTGLAAEWSVDEQYIYWRMTLKKKAAEA